MNPRNSRPVSYQGRQFASIQDAVLYIVESERRPRSDQGIALLLGCTLTAVWSARHRWGIPNSRQRRAAMEAAR